MKYIIVKVKNNGQKATKQIHDAFEEIVTLYPKPSDLLAAKQDKFLLTEVDTADLSSDQVPYENGYSLFAIQVGPNAVDHRAAFMELPTDNDYFGNARILAPKLQRFMSDLMIAPQSDQILKKPAPIEQPIELTPFQAAKIAINQLAAELRDEVNRCGFIRFFTDFNNTKAAKLAALDSFFPIMEREPSITDMDGLVKKAKELIKDPKVIYTSSVLTSRTATLLNNIIAAGDKSVTAKNTL